MAGCCCGSSSCKDNDLCDYTLNHDNPDLFDRSQVSNTVTDIVKVPEFIVYEFRSFYLTTIFIYFSGVQKEGLAFGMSSTVFVWLCCSWDVLLVMRLREEMGLNGLHT